jgi:hypothetical protein
MKNRKQLPCFGYLNNFTVDVQELAAYLESTGLLNWEKYTDINYSSNSRHQAFVVANEFCKDNFFKEPDAPMMEGELYRQLYLTDFDETKASGNVDLHNTNIFERTKRLKPSNPRYLPEADELNYGIRNHLVTGPLATLLDQFQSKITRVRLAYLSKNFEIKAHVDYDPSYVTRYHIPIITNPAVKMFIQRGDQVLERYLPADGKIYFFNSGLKHWVRNDSDQGRLHLIIDVHGQTELEHLENLD